jgi:hypothetical protein
MIVARARRSTWTPPRSAYLPLQHPQLMPQGQNFSLELCLLPIANAQQIDQKPDDRVQQACKHGSG